MKGESRKKGNKFEDSLEKSGREQGLFVFRVRDVNYMAIKKNFRVARNPYDTIMFDGKTLFALELKSTQLKSISFDGSNPQIKPHQIKSLTAASKHKGVVAGFVLNFREFDNQTFFIHIDDFNEYTKTADRKSIPIDVCQKIGVEIINTKLQVNYRYFVKDLTDYLTKKYNS